MWDMKKRVSRKSKLSHSFDFNKVPVLQVREGESFTIETEDAFNGVVKSEKDLLTPESYKPYTDFEPLKGNPITGPIYIEEANRGDILEINIKKIIPAEKGFISIYPGVGPLSDSKRWPELGEAHIKMIEHKLDPSGKTKDIKCIYNDKIFWDLAPFIGTIGVCADYEVLSSVTASFPSGGNWDCRDIKEGSKIYLNCYHKGALLYIGDVHGSQGDTEWCSGANEVKAEVTLSCNVIKEKKIPFARIDKGESIVQLFADKPLEDAVHNAIINLMDWIIKDYKLKPIDVYMILSGNPDFRVNVYQMVKYPGGKYTVGAEFPKKYLN